MVLRLRNSERARYFLVVLQNGAVFYPHRLERLGRKHQICTPWHLWLWTYSTMRDSGAVSGLYYFLRSPPDTDHGTILLC